VPATLVALLVVKVFVKEDTGLAVFVAALLATGWAGPYRVFRVELDRLASQAFTESANALGVRRAAIVMRHHLPHLVPLVAMNASQQIVASLVLLAELGVLGIFVGASRAINVAESLSKVRTGPPVGAQISELSEWGGLLANSSARSIDSLWVTRWLFLVPGVALAITAMTVSIIGFALARHYARRNLFYDLRRRGTGTLVAAIVALIALSAVVPQRYADAVAWGDAARADLRSGETAAAGFAGAGLRPLVADFTVERDTTKVVKIGPARVTIGNVSVDDTSDTAKNVRALVDGNTGGGVVEAPLVYVSRGMSPADYRPRQTSFFSPPDLGTIIKDYVDDYAGVDVRGKIVLLVRFLGVTYGRTFAAGPDAETAIDNALKRGAAAVLFVDRDLPVYVESFAGSSQRISPYRRLEDSFRITDPRGTPVVVLSTSAANRILAPTGLQLGDQTGLLDSDSSETKESLARDLRAIARVEVPLERQVAHVTSAVAEVADVDPATPRAVIWCVRRIAGRQCADVLVALARELAPRRVPFVFVDFDPSVDPNANARDIADALKGRTVGLIVVLDGLDGSALRFTTPFGDLIPSIDLYADRAGARHVVTRATAKIDDWAWPGSGAYADTRAVLMQGTGAAGDLRPDAAALLGYLAGRYALHAEELAR
jgi:hypothetical protein